MLLTLLKFDEVVIPNAKNFFARILRERKKKRSKIDFVYKQERCCDFF